MGNKVGSRRTGSAGIDTSTINGFLQFETGSDPSVRVFASQGQAEAGTDNVTLMTPLRTKQAIDEFANGHPISTKLDQNAAPTASDNASTTDDQGNNLRAGSYWSHKKDSTPEDETDWDWYLLEGFLDNGDAVWVPTTSIPAATLSTIQSNISSLQSSVTTLTTRMATAFATIFDSPSIFAVSDGQRVVELDKVPKDNSTTINSNASDGSGLFSMIEDEDYEVLGNLVFLNRASDDERSVSNGDRVDMNYFYNAFQPGDVGGTPAVGAASGGSATITWTDSGAGDDIEIYKCAAASNANVIGSWSLLATVDDDDETYAASAATGDKFRIRRKNADALKGAFSDLLTAT